MKMPTSGSDGNIGETEAAILVAGENLLSRDDIPDKNQRTHCFSCEEPMKGLYCHACGQKNDDLRRSIFSLFTEAFTSIFSLENRMWRTWRTLVTKPGKVSREFADGKRTNWTSPVRVYLALSILLFGYMSLTETRIFSLSTDIVPKAGFEGPIETLDDGSVELKYGFGFFKRQAEIDRLNQNTDFSRVSKLMINLSGEDGNETNLRGTVNGHQMSVSEIQNLADKILRNPALLNDGLSKYLPRIMFLMMPFSAIIGLLFIRDKKKALLYDHLVHSTYIHAIAFALLLLLILLAQWTPLRGGIGLFSIAIAVYLPLSAKTMFNRGWIKTIFASYSIAMIYGLAMLMVITGLTAQSITKALTIGA